MVFVKARLGLKIYKLWSRIHDLVTKWRTNVPTTDAQSLVTGVKSSLTSKINWAAAGGIFISVFELLGHALSQEDQTSLLTSIQNAATWEDVVRIIVFAGIIVIRTWFTRSITKASAKKVSG